MFRKGVRALPWMGLQQRYVTRFAFNFLLSPLKIHSAMVPIHDHDMRLDAADGLNLSIWGTYEPLETELLARRIQEGDTVLDVGAHIGYHTLICARAVGESGRVYAFEPDRGNLAILKRNVARNGYENVVPLPLAVSEETGKARLFLSAENTSDHRVYDTNDGRRSVAVDAVGLDDFFRDSEAMVDLIKLDIQGAEAAAVRGARRLLRRNESLDLLTEFWPHGLRSFGVEPKDYLRMIRDQGFRLYDINERRRRIERTTTGELLRAYRRNWVSYTNLLCTREDGALPVEEG